MLRALLLSAIAAFGCGCGKPAADKSQEKPPTQDSVAAAPIPAVSTSEGDSPSTLRPLSGEARASKYSELAVTEGGFDPASPAAPPGFGYYTVGLRGRARGGDFVLQIQPFVFAQNERGCISRPVINAAWLTNPFGDAMVFAAGKPTEGQLAFLVPADTQRIRILIAPAGAGALIVPAGDDFTPEWPAPIQTIEDGSTLRVLMLPAPAPPPVLPPPATGREQVVLDFVIENLTTEHGIEFTTSQQLRLVDQAGAFVQPSAATKQIGCRLDDGDVVPPGHSRRFQVAYDMPAGAQRRLQYRGFEVDEVSVNLP